MQERSYDWFLQILFGIGLVFLMVVFYLTRVGGIKASDAQNSFRDEYLNSTAYQLEQEVQRVEAKIRVLKSDYAGDLVNFRAALAKVKNSLELSVLEQKEKLKYLNDLYSQEYFKRKVDLIDQENAKLENLKRIECAKFCDISNL